MTNVPETLLSFAHIKQVYGLRWRIEIIFKAWKSYFNIEHVPVANLIRVLSYIYAMLIFITIFQIQFVVNYYNKCRQNSQQQLSLLKVTKFFKEQVWAITFMFSDLELVEQQLLYHCRYEKRRNRINYSQKIASLT